MAEIRVERKGGVPWWGYLLGVLVLLAVASMALRGCGTAPTRALGNNDGTARISAEGWGQQPASGPLTSTPSQGRPTKKAWWGGE